MIRQNNTKLAATDTAGELPDLDFALDDSNQASLERARPIPRISIQAFCENNHMAGVVQDASEDRRLSKAHVSVHMGGATAAVQHYQESPTPNLIIVESSLPRQQL